MATGLVEERVETMATKRNDVVVKIDSAVMAKVRVAAAFKGQSIAEYLSTIVEPIADHDIDEGHARMRKPPEPEAAPPPPKRKK
jgi:hypothetical protein